MEEKFAKSCVSSYVDAAVSCLNKNLMCPVANAQVFKDPVDNKLEILLKPSFSLAGAAMQQAVAAIGVCQSPNGHVKRLVKKDSTGTDAGSGEVLQLMF